MDAYIVRDDGTPLTKSEEEAILKCLKRRYFSHNEDEDPDASGCSVNSLVSESHNARIYFEEDADYVHVAALCPGIDLKRLQVFTDGDRLVLHSQPAESNSKVDGEKHFLQKCADEIVYEGECVLPVEVDPCKAEAQFGNGILYVKLPKSEKVKPKYIPVK